MLECRLEGFGVGFLEGFQFKSAPRFLYVAGFRVSVSGLAFKLSKLEFGSWVLQVS